jgi:multisubunit Na+/H+ antiporter MnhC subunit
MEPYLVEQTAHGTEFRIPPDSARKFARFGAGVMGLLGGVVGAIVGGGGATFAAGSPQVVVVTAVVCGVAFGGLAASAALHHLTRATIAALVIGTDGGVRFGLQTLVTAGTATGVRVHRTCPVN